MTCAGESSPSRLAVWSPNKWYVYFIPTSSLVWASRYPSLVETKADNAAVPSANYTRPEPHLPRHQTRQFPDWTTRYQGCQCCPRRRLWNGKAIPRPKDKATYPIQGAQESEWNSEIHVDQHSLGTRAITARRSRGAWSCVFLLFERWSTVAGIKGGYQQAKVRKDWGKEADHAYPRACRWLPQ